VGGGGGTHDVPCGIVSGAQHWTVVKFGGWPEGQHIAGLEPQDGPVATQAVPL